MKAGVIGLGNMGRAMAERLISEGTDLIVWNRDPSKTKGLNAEIGESPAQVVARAEVVFLSLFDSDAVTDVITGPHGILIGDCDDKIIVDTTTNHFASVLTFYDLIGKVGGHYLESPVFGSVGPASKGALTIAVSGDRESYCKVRPLLNKLGNNIFYLGKATLATRMKLVNNLVLGSLMASLAEAVVCAESSGIDKETAIEILGVGAGNSAVLHGRKEKLLHSEFSPQFTIDAIYKDLHYLQDLSRDINRPLFMAAMARELFGIARSRGLNGRDISAILQALDELNKVPEEAEHYA